MRATQELLGTVASMANIPAKLVAVHGLPSVCKAVSAVWVFNAAGINFGRAGNTDQSDDTLGKFLIGVDVQGVKLRPPGLAGNTEPKGCFDFNTSQAIRAAAGGP